MKDKFKVETFHVISESDWNEIVRTHYDAEDYSFWENEEADNGGSYTFSVEKEELSDYNKDQLKNLKDIYVSFFMAHAILIDLCNQGFIDEGQYIITEVGC